MTAPYRLGVMASWSPVAQERLLDDGGKLLIRYANSTKPSFRRKPESRLKQTTARFARHWIPAFAGMTLLLFECRNNNELERRRGAHTDY